MEELLAAGDVIYAANWMGKGEHAGVTGGRNRAKARQVETGR